MFNTFDSRRSEAIAITPNTLDRDAIPLVASIKPNTERTYKFKPMNSSALLRILRERGFRVLLGIAAKKEKALRGQRKNGGAGNPNNSSNCYKG